MTRGSDSTHNETPGRRRIVHALAALLAVVTIIIYAPAGHFEFVHYDDPHYVFGAPQLREGITVKSLHWAITNTDGNYWHPVSSLFHLAVTGVIGLEPGPQHLVNVGLFLATAVALFYVLASTMRSPVVALFGAALWAWHPLRVESVAWVTERGGLLAGLLCVCALGAYVSYTRRRSPWTYALVLVLFALAMLSKPTAVAFPIGLLLLDLWPLERAPQMWRQGGWGGWKRLLVEKLPLLLVAAGVALLTAHLVGIGTGSHLRPRLAIVDRLLAIPAAYGWFLWKTIAPLDLSVHYPWSVAWPRVAGVGALAIVLAITWFVARGRRAPLVAAWFWFIVMLFPMLAASGLRTSWVADRYSYLPHMLLLPGIVAAVALNDRTKRGPWVLAGATLLAVCALLSSMQLQNWQQSETLFGHALDITPDDAVVRYNWGVALGEQGRFDEAREQYAQAVRLKPDYIEAHVNLGAALQMLGDRDGALAHYRAALRLNPRDADAKANLEALLAGGSGPSTAPSTNPSTRPAQSIAP